MFDIGFPELLLISVVVLLVFGPERLPEVLRTVGVWLGRARRSFASLRDEIEREIGADEIRREVHNARILDEARELGQELDSFGREVSRDVDEAARAETDTPAETRDGEAHAPRADGDPALETQDDGRRGDEEDPDAAGDRDDGR